MTTPANFQLAHFLKSAPDLTHCPPDSGCEIAFAGRSNAGKSSCINTLTGIGGLARTSKTPGRTQLINFFALRTEAQRLVDLPGYGYAKVSRDIKNEWQKNLGEYLQERQSLRGLVLIMDIRHPLKDYDLNMLEWARAAQLPVHMVLTKADKLNRGPAANTLQQALRDTGDGTLVTGQTFSSLRKDGVDELRLKLGGWLSEQ